MSSINHKNSKPLYRCVILADCRTQLRLCESLNDFGLSSQKYIFIIILFIIFKSYIHYTRYQENIFPLNILRKWFSNQNRNHLHFESRYSLIFCEPQGLRNRGEGGRRAISPPDFGRNRSRLFSFKRPTCPSKFIDLLAGLLSDFLDACDYQPLFPPFFLSFFEIIFSGNLILQLKKSQ